MRKSFAILAIAAGLSFGLAAAPASAALSITNGSFELGPDPGSFTTLNNGDTSITGWTVGGLGVDYIGSYWQASDGVRSIDLNGLDQGSIWQQLTGLTIGQNYSILFDMAGNPDGGGSTKVAVVSDAGNQTDVFNFNTAGTTHANMGWVTQQFNFTATSTSALLTFSSAQNNPFGAAIDNVRDAAVPEPATWAMMLVGFGGLGAMLRRKRRQLAIA